MANIIVCTSESEVEFEMLMENRHDLHYERQYHFTEKPGLNVRLPSFPFLSWELKRITEIGTMRTPNSFSTHQPDSTIPPIYGHQNSIRSIKNGT